MSCTCGCCDGLHAVTPRAIDNRPGLGAIRTRIGTHADFLETMRARLSSADYPELAGLRTREPGDSVIAMLDAWATIADILCFYQERIANEGYLRTATERRSLVELARLIGYVPRPGVAASVYLAFGLEQNAAPTVVPKGTKANSIPNPGETMQAFETSADLSARVEWNAIRPRLLEPQSARTILQDGLFLKGTATRLKRGDMLLLGRPGTPYYAPIRVATVEPDEAAKRTRVTLAVPNMKPVAPNDDDGAEGKPVLDAATLDALRRPAARTPRGPAHLSRSVGATFSRQADTFPRLLADFDPALAGTLHAALRNAGPSVALPFEVLAMRIEARPFGHNAPLQLTGVGGDGKPPTFTEWPLNSNYNTVQYSFQIGLDADYDVATDTRVLIQRADMSFVQLPPSALIRHESVAAFGLSGKSVVISWGDEFARWLYASDDFTMVRGSRVYLGSERLDLADAPITADIAGDTIELDTLYDGLDPGRWLIVEGERTDILDGSGRTIPGIRATELVMLAGVDQAVRAAGPQDPASDQGAGKDPPVSDNFAVSNTPPKDPDSGTSRGTEPGDTYHTVLTLAASTAAGAGLAYRYKRDTVTVYANVAHATHGETRTEVMGSGNAAQPLQAFLLRQPPLTHVSARTQTGIASTLEVRVNDVLWHEASTLVALGPADRKYTLRIQDDDKPVVIFGNGVRGQRLPTGRENVKARYRSGIGMAGNVAARQISLLAARPLGVKDVVNPIRASGGADRESADAIRRNAPIAIMALDRLLSTSDYADFARAFGGVGKAAAWRTGQRITVIVAGVDDAPIDPSSDLFANLKDALHRFGDAMLPLTLRIRERLSIVLQARVRIDPDYLWEAVEPQIRAAMLAAFAFDTQDLGKPAFLAHAFRVIQSVRGVVSGDIDVFDAISGDQLLGNSETLVATLATARQRIAVAPHQIAYLSPAVPDTLILQELPS